MTTFDYQDSHIAPMSYLWPVLAGLIVGMIGLLIYTRTVRPRASTAYLESKHNNLVIVGLLEMATTMMPILLLLGIAATMVTLYPHQLNALNAAVDNANMHNADAIATTYHVDRPIITNRTGSDDTLDITKDQQLLYEHCNIRPDATHAHQAYVFCQGNVLKPQ